MSGLVACPNPIELQHLLNDKFKSNTTPSLRAEQLYCMREMPRWVEFQESNGFIAGKLHKGETLVFLLTMYPNISVVP